MNIKNFDESDSDNLGFQKIKKSCNPRNKLEIRYKGRKNNKKKNKLAMHSMIRDNLNERYLRQDYGNK